MVQVQMQLEVECWAHGNAVREGLQYSLSTSAVWGEVQYEYECSLRRGSTAWIRVQSEKGEYSLNTSAVWEGGVQPEYECSLSESPPEYEPERDYSLNTSAF